MPLCGSGLARDSLNSVCEKHRAACIASKPAPTGFEPVSKAGNSSAPAQSPCAESRSTLHKSG
ncbi:hypothetical protein EQV96_00195 [Pseudomonas sp. TMW22080]|nr:hypothetical protein [Pseudomonas sp. TMW22080]